MPQRNDMVTVVANDRVIDVPQSYVDRFPDLYKPVELKQDGGLRAPDAQKYDDARGKALPPFATTPSELPSTGGAVVDTTADATDATPTGAATTTRSRAAANTDGGSNA